MSRRNLAGMVFVAAVSVVCWRIASSAPTNGRYDVFRIFVGTLSQVERDYVRDVEREDLFRGGLSGLMESLDSDSSYLSPEVYERAKAGANGDGDVGIHLGLLLPHRQVFVLGVAPGSVAEKAGLTPGDWITEIDDRSAARMSVEEAAQLLQGQVGTEVNLQLSRPFARRGGEELEDDEDDAGLGNEGTVHVTLKRETLAEAHLLGRRKQAGGEWDWSIENETGLGYVRVSTLAPGATAALRGKLEELQRGGLRGVILDLRFCTAGLHEEAVELADLFVTTGRLLSVSGRNLNDESWEAKSEGTITEPKVCVLVGPYTAGAGEAFAAALQDHGRAKVVGMRTMGKAGVSRLVPLRDGKSALKLTVGTLVRPNGKSLFRSPRVEGEGDWGVRPDEGLAVLQDPREVFQEFRRQSGEATERRGREGPAFVDTGLQKAVEVLKGQLAG